MRTAVSCHLVKSATMGPGQNGCAVKNHRFQTTASLSIQTCTEHAAKSIFAPEATLYNAAFPPQRVSVLVRHTILSEWPGHETQRKPTRSPPLSSRRRARRIRPCWQKACQLACRDRMHSLLQPARIRHLLFRCWPPHRQAVITTRQDHLRGTIPRRSPSRLLARK